MQKLIDVVSTFKYLGALFSEYGRIETELYSHISAANRLQETVKLKLLGKMEISNKMAVYKNLHMPTLVFGCES